MKKIGIEESALCPCGPADCEQTPWNSHRPTPDGAVHCPDGTPKKSSSNAEEDEEFKTHLDLSILSTL